jgi:hypothetical protein
MATEPARAAMTGELKNTPGIRRPAASGAGAELVASKVPPVSGTGHQPGSR